MAYEALKAYSTRDLTRLLPGTAFPAFRRMAKVTGRTDDMMIVRGVNVFPSQVEEQILRPLRMTATTFHPRQVPANRLAYGYRWEDDRWKDEPLLEHGPFGAMGGMLTRDGPPIWSAFTVRPSLRPPPISSQISRIVVPKRTSTTPGRSKRSFRQMSFVPGVAPGLSAA